MEWKKENLSMCTLPGQTTTIAPKKKSREDASCFSCCVCKFFGSNLFSWAFFFRVAADCDGK